MTSFLSWSEGRWLDLWTLVHISGGVVAGIFFQAIHMQLGWAVLVGLIAATLWEIREHAIGVQEIIANSVLDVLIAAMASYASYTILETVPEMYWLEILLVAIALWSFLGYIGYKHYRK